ncbi:hypothetical protein [Micromonospora sp. NPDC023737]|uniref:hypothetical protein n=1 Tax=unclassified Micromonospora TaxID=2617518 RepID=UPI00340C852E
MEIQGRPIQDTLPCHHDFPSDRIGATKSILRNLSDTSPHLLHSADIQQEDWLPLLRAAIESMRGESSANPVEKQRFIAAVLQHCQQQKTIESWGFIGSGGRQDYRVSLPDGTTVAIEAKGCLDGNNTAIWDRPSWADEFVVWGLCPEGLAKPPGKGAWSGIATRLMPKIVAERKVVDAFVLWDGRCGSARRICPKAFGVDGPLRSQATDIVGQVGKEAWIPPPCIYLFPRSYPTVPHNRKPAIHTVNTARFSRALLEAFNVPEDKQAAYVHSVEVEARGSSEGTEIQVTAVSRCWPDGDDRVVSGRWKPVRREA